MNRILALVLTALVSAALSVPDAAAAAKKRKKPPSESPTQVQSKPSANTYGAGCKNQGASIMSGGCVN